MYTKITISGKICSGKSTLFVDLTTQLGWPTFSTSQLFRQESKRLGVTLESADEQQEALTKRIDSQIREELLSHDNIIVEAWMGGIMAEGMPNVLRVFLTAEDDVRFQRFAQREGVSMLHAQEKVVQREKSWLAKLSNIYGRTDFYDPKHYDFVLDTSQLPPKAVYMQVLERLSS